jgi:thiol-disulfide isomerase/thioredoxin
VVIEGSRDRGIEGSTPAARYTLHAARLLALAVLLVSGRLPAQDQIGIAVGSMPAAVAVEDLDGGAVDLAQWIGKKPVVLQFWATWCPVCEALHPKVQAARAAHGDAVAFVVVAVGVNQSQRSVRRYLEKHPDMGTVVWDGKGGAVRAFEAPGTSYVVALDRSGKVVYTGFGADQDIAGAFSAAVR